MNLEKSLRKGINAHKSGNLKKANSFYAAVLKEVPNHPDLVDAPSRPSGPENDNKERQALVESYRGRLGTSQSKLEHEVA